MSTERALVPLDADLEEVTDLPPPAPGLRSPVADHSFDPPTLPGIVAPHRMLPLSDRLVDSLSSHELSTQLLAHHFSGPASGVPHELREEKTLQMPAPHVLQRSSDPAPAFGRRDQGHPRIGRVGIAGDQSRLDQRAYLPVNRLQHDGTLVNW